MYDSTTLKTIGFCRGATGWSRIYFVFVGEKYGIEDLKEVHSKGVLQEYERRYLVALESPLGEQRQCVLHDWQRLHIYDVPLTSFHFRTIIGCLLHGKISPSSSQESCCCVGSKQVKQKFT